MTLQSLKSSLAKAANPAKVATYKNFHKTQKGDYAEGDEFLGLTVPQLRLLAQKHHTLSFSDIDVLLASKIHEERYVAALVLVYKYERAEPQEKKRIVDFYLNNAQKFSGWDLVDSTAPSIVGNFLLDKDISILKNLAHSSNLWERRIAIISAYAFIKNNRFDETLTIAQLLLNDTHDLIHKAVGWMLREVGKRDQETLETFLKKHYRTMPRTMLRYSIERFPEKERRAYLKGDI